MVVITSFCCLNVCHCIYRN